MQPGLSTYLSYAKFRFELNLRVGVRLYEGAASVRIRSELLATAEIIKQTPAANAHKYIRVYIHTHTLNTEPLKTIDICSHLYI